MSEGTRIERVFFQSTAQLAMGPGSALIQGFLSEAVGARMCLALIARPDGRFTLVLDNEWIGLGFRIRDREAGVTLTDDFEIPRQAIQAVIAGWPADWDADASPTLSTHYSHDNIPHLSVNDAEITADPSSVTWIDEPTARLPHQ
ncbi:MAG: hypothetical protein HKN03_03220 [Acidimicrobiales bacterium]|nr:hypothetical protein [Acidimicrobiales bacterium]